MMKNILNISKARGILHRFDRTCRCGGRPCTCGAQARGQGSAFTDAYALLPPGGHIRGY